MRVMRCAGLSVLHGGQPKNCHVMNPKVVCRDGSRGNPQVSAVEHVSHACAGGFYARGGEGHSNIGTRGCIPIKKEGHHVPVLKGACKHLRGSPPHFRGSRQAAGAIPRARGYYRGHKRTITKG